MKRRTIIFSFLFFNFLFIDASISFSQQINLDFQYYSKEEGISSSAPYAVLKDSKGFIWIATQNGLNRFDGKEFKVYNHDIRNPNSISDDYITCICEDSEGNIWAGTISNGLNKLDRKTGKFEIFLNNPDDENSLSNNNIRALIFCDDKIWVGTQLGGLNIIDLTTSRITRLRNNPENPLSLSNDFIWTLYKDRESNIWIGTNGGGLDKLNKSDNTFTHYQHNPYDIQSISFNEVRTIYEDKDGNIWIGTNGKGVNVLNKKTGKFERIINKKNKNTESQNNVVLGIIQDENSNIWIGEYFNGLSIYNPNTDEFYNINYSVNGITSLLLDNVFSLFKDNSGIIWICNEGKGLFIYNSNKAQFKCFRNNPADRYSLCNNTIWNFCEDNKGNIWIATKNGLSIFEPLTERFRNYFSFLFDRNSISGNSILFTYRDNSNHMWISTQAGILDRYDLSTDKWQHYYTHPDDTSKKFTDVICMIEDNEEQLWLGTYSNGLKMFTKDRTKVVTYLHNDNETNSISSDGIIDLNIDRDGNLWIGTYTTGMDKFDIKTNKFTNYRYIPGDTNRISSNIISDVHQDKEGIYWITTFGGGLNRFDFRNNKLSHYTKKNGLPDNTLYGILEDSSGIFWISTNQGISRFNPKKEIFVNYNTSDGLQSQEFNQNSLLKSSTGELYFGGINGFNVIEPLDFSISSSFSPAVFTSFRVFNEEIELPVSISESREIELSYRDNFFTIGYTVLEFTDPTKIEFAYKLEGVDEKWNYVKNVREAHYTNVEPGDYIFELKYTNGVGVWNEEGKSIKIIITPPWWKTYWFRGFIIMLFIFVVGFIFQKRISIERKKHKAKEEFARQLIESQEQERKRIASELHDSLAQNLLVIKNKTILSVRGPDETKKLKNDMKEITKGISESMEEIRTISHNLRPLELERFGLTSTIEMLVEKINKSSAVNISFTSNKIDGILEQKDEMNIFRIIQECINNIIKHSGANNAGIIISKSEGAISINIKDNGKGFDFEKNIKKPESGGFGLRGMTERVSLLNGKVNCNSKPGKGTEINIIIPVTIKK